MTGNSLPLLKEICEGCLSTDRKLRSITDVAFYEYYMSLIPEKCKLPPPLVLCYQCIASIQHHLTFRQQCLIAHNTLVKYVKTPTNIISLSRLTTVKNNVKVSIPDISDDVTPHEITSHDFKSQNIYLHNETENIQNSSNFEANFHFASDVSIQSASDFNFASDLCEGKRDRDIQFIKIEEDGVNDDYVYEGFDANTSLNDDKITKSSVKKIADDDFNDSDDEPLTKKKKERVRVRKTKTKKDGGARRGERENPSGVVNTPRVTKKLEQLNIAPGQLEMIVLTWEQVINNAPISPL